MAQEKYRVNIVWFRNGLRLHDSGPLHKATEEQEVDINIFYVLAFLSCIKTYYMVYLDYFMYFENNLIFCFVHTISNLLYYQS